MKEYYTSRGIIKLDYKHRVIDVPFSVSLYGYGGAPLASVKDKYNGHHTFVRGVHDEWQPIGRGPKWPKEFLALLYDALEIEFKVLEAKHRPK